MRRAKNFNLRELYLKTSGISQREPEGTAPRK